MATVGLEERRSKPRIYIPFPATVSGVDEDGEEFMVSATIDNLSSGGLYVRIVPCVKIGARLLIIFRLSTAATAGKLSPRVSVKGRVIRVDRKFEGVCGVAVKFGFARFVG